MGDRSRYRVAMLLPLFMAALTVLFAEEPEYHVLESSNLSVIYESPYTDQAGAVSQDLQTILPWYRDVLGVDTPFDWPVILQFRSSTASGFVSLPVQRSVWEMIPYDGFMRGDLWLHLLALHEGRHMVQYEALNRGISRLFYYAGGPELMTSLVHALVPDWIFEGDAVVSETIYSQEGRGRSAEFERRMRALILEHPDVSWYEITNGSYVHAYPNEYQYGYFLIGYLMREYGADTVTKLFESLGTVPVPFLSPSIALSRITGEMTTEASLFKMVKNDLYTRWSEQASQKSITSRDVVAVSSVKGYSHVLDMAVDGGVLTVAEYDRSHGNTLVSYDLTTGDLLPGRIRLPSQAVDIGRTKVAWVERRPARWNEQADRAVLVAYDRDLLTMTDLAEGMFLGDPALSSDERLVAVVAFTPGSGSAIQIYSITGELTDTIEFDAYTHVSDVAWCGDQLLCITENDQGRDLQLIDLESHAQRTLWSFTDEFVYGFSPSEDSSGTIYYSSDRSGTQELYALDPQEMTAHRLTSSRYGLWHPALYHGDIYAIEMISSDKEAVVRIDPSAAAEDYNDRTEYVSQFYAADIFPHTASLDKSVSNSIPQPYETKAFIFDPYAWGVLIPQYGNELSIGVRCSDPFLSQQWAVSFGYQFDTSQFGTRLSWRRHAGIVDSVVSAAFWQDTLSGLTYGIGYEVSAQVFSAVQYGAYGKTGYHLFGGYVLSSSDNLPDCPVVLGVTDKLSYGQGAPLRSLLPYDLGFSQAVTISYGPDMTAWAASPIRISYDITGYLPGVLTDDGLIVQNQLNWRNTDSFPWKLDPARGYSLGEISSAAGDGDMLGTGSVGYHIPLAYPDAAVWGLSFVKRLRSEWFFDMSYGRQGVYPSMGFEALADMTFFNRDMVELSSGFRGAWRFEDSRFVLDLILFGVSIPL